MYDLMRSANDRYALYVDKTCRYEGSLRDIIKVAHGLGFELNELEDAITEMAWMDHNSAQFGIYKRFIFTYDYKEKAA